MKKLPNKYIWWKDRKILGVILLILAAVMQVFAFLQVPLISSIHSYTMGMLVGFYNPFFYGALVFYALKLIFDFKFKKIKWLKITWLRYFLFVFAIITVGTCSSYYQKQVGYQVWGLDAWKVFPKWFDEYTNAPPWLAKNTNGGLIGAFIFAFLAMIATGTGAFIIAIICLMISLSSFFIHNLIVFLKNKQKLQKKLAFEKRQLKKPGLSNLTQRQIKTKDPGFAPHQSKLLVDKIKTQSSPSDSKLALKFDTQQKEPKITDPTLDLPFEDPFQD